VDTDLTLSLHDLPQQTAAEIFDALARAHATGTAAHAVVIFNRTGATTMGEVTVRDDETGLSATVTALDAEGHETTFDETPTWQSSDDSVATCSPSADGYSCTFDIGAPGSAVITVTGVENSSGEDVQIISTGLINVTAGDAVVGSIDFEVAPTEPTGANA
jgi:hypothetical protein